MTSGLIILHSKTSSVWFHQSSGGQCWLHQEVACEGGVDGGGELAAVSETAEDVARDEFVGGGGGDSDFVVERSGAVEAAGEVDGREGVDAEMEGEGGGGGGSGAADVAEAVLGVAGAVDGETGAGDADVTVVEEGVDTEGGFDCRNEIGMKEEVEEEEVDAEGGLDLGDEIEMKEDVGGSGESHEHIAGISDEAAEKAELMGSADIRGADAGCTAVASVVEEEVGIETEGGCDNGSGIEIKENIMESGDFSERVVGICNEETPKAELMESVSAEEANVVVADVADGEEDVAVGRNKEELIEDGGVDNKVVVEGQDDVVAADVDDSGVSKEEEVVAMVEEDGAALVEEEEVVVEDNVGSHDVGMEKGVVDVNETEKASVSEFFPNVESMSGVVAFAVEESDIADSKAEISLAENERVTGGDGESNGVVGMVDEIPMVGKEIGEMDVGINAGINGAAETDERETADSIADGEEKEQDDAAVGVLGMLSDDATIEADETNGLANVDSTEGTDRKEVGDVGAEIDVEADDAVEDNVAEDKEIDDVLEGTEDTERVDRPEETDATEDTDMAEEEMEKVEQRKMNVLLNRKGGKSSKGGRASSKKKLEEDVCFICFDGGDLVLCDRRGCPKVYHPSCVNRDEAFFQTKGQWNCGWHLCSSCKKNAHYLCYTCTFSLCKSCVKDGIIYVVRGNKGFCDICMRTVRMIENVIQGDNATGQVDFDDKTSWEYLFKDYYMDLKEKLSITAEEIEGAKNPWKGADVNSGKQEFQDNAYDDGVGSDDSAGQSEVSLPKKRKASKRLKSHAKERKLSRRSNRVNVTDVSRTDGVEWATKELLDFVMHMKDGDRSVLSQFDVQALLLEYIKTNKLRDPRRKSQIICDSRLQSLFGKPRVGHFEMLKLLESHFLIKDDTGDLQGSVVDIDANQTDADQNADISPKAGKQKKRKTRRRGDNRVLQSNIDDYAAIDVHNMTLIYLRRSLVEDLLEDTETFEDKVIGSFVRIRIPGNNPKQEMYRLVPIIGTSKVPKPYKVGKKHTDYVLEIQNLGKPETIQIDIISNQEFTQDECLRLRQSIKYGVTNRLTVGDIQDKAIALQEVRVKDWLDAEIVRLSHLRDRASEKGHAKELRECVEKLQLLKMPQERQRRLNEVSEIHADPKMDPNNESDDDEDIPTRGRSNASGGKSREPISPSKGVSSLNDSWGGIRNHSSGNRELTRSMSSKGVESWSDDGIRAVGEGVNQNTYLLARERDLSSEIGAGSANARLKIDSSSKVAPETPVVSLAPSTLESTDKVNESEKMWHYKDPSGKIQGPFSIVQLRKWNNTGYFPVDLRIWRDSETQDDTILLSDALKGKFLRVRPKTVSTAPAVQSQYPSSLYAANQSPVLQGSEPIGDRIVSKVPPSSVEIPKFSSSRWSSGTNLPSPTPHQTTPSAVKGPTDEVKWSSVPAIANSSVAAQSSTPSLVNTGGITGADVLRNVSSVLSQDPNMLMNAASALLAQSQSALPGQQRLNMETHVQNAQAPDVKNPGSAIQNLVQAVQSHNPAANVQGWGSASAPPEISGSAPSHRSGQWGEPPMQNPASYGTASSGGAFPNHWRPNSGDQSNFQSAAVPSANWGVNNATNAFAAVPAPNSQSQPNPNPNWMQAPGNTGWAGSAPGNANMNWSGNSNAGLPGQGRPQGAGTMPGWNAPSQGAFGNTVNPGMVPPAQAPPTQNSSFGWSGPGNRGGWMGDKNHNDGRYRERGDSGYGGGRPWNRQSSFGGRDQGVCWYQDEYGNCRRGASCKFRHAGGSSGDLG